MVGELLSVDLAHWPWPIGNAFRDGVAGNIEASAIWGPIGLLLGMAWEKRRVIAPIHAKLDRHQEHHEAHAEALANIQQQLSSMGGSS